MTHPYEPIYKGHTITIVDTILAGIGFEARFYINKGDSHRYQFEGPICLKREEFVETSSSPQQAVERALSRAHAWIDAHIQD